MNTRSKPNVAETELPLELELLGEIDPTVAVKNLRDFIKPNGVGTINTPKTGPLRRTMAPMYVRTFNIGRGRRFAKRRNLARKKKWIPYNKYMAQKRRYKYGRYTNKRRYYRKRTYKRGGYRRTYRRRY